MSAIERVYKYFEFKGIAPTAFEKKHGISNGYFSKQKKNKGKISEDVLVILLENCNDLNLHWVILGKGEMIQNLSISSSISQKDKDVIQSLKSDAELLLKRIKNIEEALFSK